MSKLNLLRITSRPGTIRKFNLEYYYSNITIRKKPMVSTGNNYSNSIRIVIISNSTRSKVLVCNKCICSFCCVQSFLTFCVDISCFVGLLVSLGDTELVVGWKILKYKKLCKGRKVYHKQIIYLILKMKRYKNQVLTTFILQMINGYIALCKGRKVCHKYVLYT